MMTSVLIVSAVRESQGRVFGVTTLVASTRRLPVREVTSTRSSEVADWRAAA